MSNKRKVCFVITSKIHYGRSRLILDEIKKRDDLELQIVVGASALLSTYGDVLELMQKDGYDYDAKIVMTLEGGSPVAMAKTTGIGITEFATAFDNLRPDVVIVRGDRYEVLSAAVAAAYLNIPLAHIEGGDVTGSIDESVRHAVTKLSHIHFPTNEMSAERIKRMGEDPEYIHNVGCPGLEFVAQNNFSLNADLINRIGVGDVVDVSQDYLVVMQHPVTSEVGSNRKHVTETLHALKRLDLPTIWFWPNVDAGTDGVSKAIRVFREKYNPSNIRFLKYIPADQFTALLKGAACMIGNSSAGIKEASFLGTPVVNIGSRQSGRMRGENVIDVDYDREQIEGAVRKQLAHGRYVQSNAYFKENTSSEIARILAQAELYTQKRFAD